MNTKDISKFVYKMYPSTDRKILDGYVDILKNIDDKYITTVFSLENACKAKELPSNLPKWMLRDFNSYFEMEFRKKDTFGLGHLMKILFSASFKNDV